MFERRIHWRNLLDLTDKPIENPFYLITIGSYRPAIDHIAFGIAGTGCLPQAAGGAVSLARIQQVSGELGRLTQAYRQNPGSQRVEAAAMPRLACTEKASYLLQGMVRAPLERFIEDQNAIDIPVIAGVSPAHYCLALILSLATAESIKSDSCRPRISVSS